jgi:Tfp pilus assembly protein PilF
MRTTPLLALALVVASPLHVAAAGGVRVAADGSAVYEPALKVPDDEAPFLANVQPGGDAFPDEAVAAALQPRLGALGARLKADVDGGAAGVADLLAPGFRGGRLAAPEAWPEDPTRAIAVRRTDPFPPGPTLDASAFATELRRLLAAFRGVDVAEFLVTSITVDGDGTRASTEVRAEIAGPGRAVHRAALVARWRMAWSRGADGWRAREWTTDGLTESRAARPVYTEATTAALGGDAAFRRQLTIGLDDWMARFDSGLARDSNGHHGVSVGDADGDGLDDLYVAQPQGLPNRLFRARGDGTFEDATESSGLDVLDDTAQSLFADVDNDGDQDLVLATGVQPLLFVNDGRGRFAHASDAFRFEKGVQGAITSIAMSDYDRDGFLDLYVCVYSYLYGAADDKAGTPMPYHDARNGPPGLLFRNDGRGRFVETTTAAGLLPSNERYHFAAAWADYDEDGWPDLLVANDFGTNNLYRNRGDGTFEDAAEAAGVLDHAAGMSAAFFDYDNDGRLDIYTGNIWSENGRRVTAGEAFMPGAPADVRALYRRHARGNSLFRNLGGGRFEDVTLPARAEFGRWAWSSDALDLEGDGLEDLYVVNGMLTRDGSPADLDGFFWRQVVARSPLTRVPGTPYDDAWRAMNRMLIRWSIASGQRNVVLRNDGRGGFDDVSGVTGLDLDQDGRSFGVLDLDRDGDPDLAVMAARQAPQLRVFRNDATPRGAALAVRLTGAASNRDAVGALVTVETEALRRTKQVTAGSGFLSQHSKEILFGLGASREVRRLTVAWPSGRTQTFDRVPIGHRLRLVEGGELRAEPLAPPVVPSGAPAVPPPAVPPSSSWLYEPFPAPAFSLPDLGGTTRSLESLRGKPAVLLLWASGAAASRAALEAVGRERTAFERAGVGALALALDAPGDLPAVRAAAAGVTVPVVPLSEEVAVGYAIFNRYVFMNRQPLRLPAAFLLDAAGGAVRAYAAPLDVGAILRDARAIDAPAAARLARAMLLPGKLYGPPGLRNHVTYGRELLDHGLEPAALVAFERAAQSTPRPWTLYRLATLLVRAAQPARARAALERALEIQPDFAEASNDLGALLAQQGDLAAAVLRFRAALAAIPDYPDALNNLGYALLLGGDGSQARALYEKALALQPDFPEVLNNLGTIMGRDGDHAGAESYFRRALQARPDYGEAANNLALVLASRGDLEAATRLLTEFLEANPSYEGTYVTLAKVHEASGRRAEAVAVLERLLQRNPTHALAIEILRAVR